MAHALLVLTLLAATPKAPSAVDPAQLDALLARARATQSDAVVVLHDGKVVAEEYFGGKPHPIEAMSATKSVVALAIGRLITTGKLKSLDEPVHTFFPEWRQGRKKEVTVRHLMNHTSGLQNVPNTTVEIYPSPDFVKLALAAELSDAPGAKFEYNNKAVNLLAGVVERASGKKLDVYLRDELFRPMGITRFTWSKDPAGNPHAMSGLQILPADFAKLGQLMLDRGVWKGRRLLSEAFVDEALAQGQPHNARCGLLWWRLVETTYVADDAWFQAMARAWVDAALLLKLEPLRGKTFKGEGQLVPALQQLFGPTWQQAIQELNAKGTRMPRTYGAARGYEANGYLGQYVTVLPAQRLVAVRMFEPDSEDVDPSKLDPFMDFSERVEALVPAPAAAPAAPADAGASGR